MLEIRKCEIKVSLISGEYHLTHVDINSLQRGAFYHREKRSHETEFRVFVNVGLSLVSVPHLSILFRHMPSN